MALLLSAAPWEANAQPEAGALSLDDLTLLPPIQPSKIVCVGRNYAKHAQELGNALPSTPLIFLKPPSALIAHNQAIEIPEAQTRLVHHEGELAVIMGQRARRINPGQARESVFGYSLMNDVTARDVQREEGKFTRAKGFDTFAPLGPFIDTDFQPASQTIQVHVNNELRQDGQLSDMVFGVFELISTISHIMTLEPFDIISTGTPSGVGPLTPGDVVEVRIEGLGTLRNHVIAREAS